MVTLLTVDSSYFLSFVPQHLLRKTPRGDLHLVCDLIMPVIGLVRDVEIRNSIELENHRVFYLQRLFW